MCIQWSVPNLHHLRMRYTRLCSYPKLTHQMHNRWRACSFWQQQLCEWLVIAAHSHSKRRRTLHKRHGASWKFHWSFYKWLTAIVTTSGTYVWQHRYVDTCTRSAEHCQMSSKPNLPHCLKDQHQHHGTGATWPCQSGCARQHDAVESIPSCSGLRPVQPYVPSYAQGFNNSQTWCIFNTYRKKVCRELQGAKGGSFILWAKTPLLPQYVRFFCIYISSMSK